MAIAAWVCARSANELLELALWKLDPPTSVVVRAPEPGTHPRLELPALEHVLGMPPQPTLRPAVKHPRARLVGTLVARRPEWSWALLALDGPAEPRMVGDTFDDGIIESIELSKVSLRTADGLETIELAGRPDGTPPAPTPGPLRVERAKVQALLADPTPILREVRLMPVFLRGELSGFRTEFVQPGSLFARAGLQTGDVIRRIGGIEARTPAELLAAVPRWMSGGGVDVDVDRGGTPARLRVELAD